jgi:tetratricopeptide (TPR) repeat protein
MTAKAQYREFQRAVAGRLVHARRDSSQNGLAKELGYSQQMISRYESGRIPKCFFFLARLVERRKVDVNWILAGEGSKPSVESMEIVGAGVDEKDERALIAGGDGAHGSRGLLREELPPELYEAYEAEVVVALLSFWTQSSGTLRELLVNRLRSLILWWKVQQPALSVWLGSLCKALDEEGLSYVEPLRQIAEHFRGLEDMDSLRRGIRLYKFLLGEFEKHGREADRANALLQLAQMYRKTAQWTKAREFYTSALRAAEALDDPVVLEEAWAGLGNLAADVTDLASARTYFRKELEAAMRTQDSRLRIRSYVSLSLVAAESKQRLEEGLEYANQGLALCEQHADEEYYSELLINRGLILAALGQAGAAKVAYREAIRRASPTKEARLKATAYHNWADLVLAEGKLEETEDLLMQAQTWCGRAELPHLNCSIQMIQARVHMRAGRVRDAARACRRALQIAEKHSLESCLDEAHALSLEIEEGIPALVKIA